jgi:hypothetical protein
MNRKLVVLALALAAIALGLSACGGTPTSASGASAVLVRGVLLGEGASVTGITASSLTGAPNTSSGSITVTVEGAGITTTISGNGSFELEDVPAGTFTLVFKRDGVEIGRLTITAESGMQVEIVVKLESSIVVLVDLKLEHKDDKGNAGNDSDAAKTCLIEGGRVGDRIELEGNVTSVSGTSFTMTTSGNRAHGPVDVSASAASFKCNGSDKKSTTSCQASVKTGAQVHVRGTLTSCSLSSATITATEVKVQKSGDDDD